MADFVSNLSNLADEYDSYLTAKTALTTEQAALVTVQGTLPAKPIQVIVNADWNGWVTSYETYLASLATAKANVNTAQLALNSALGSVCYELGIYNPPNSTTVYNADSIQVNQWCKVVIGGGANAGTYYIGMAADNINIVESNVLPTQDFPNV